MLLLPFAHLLAGASPALAAPSPAPGFEFTAEDPKPPVLDVWTGSVAVAATSSDGNTERNTIGASAQAERRSEKDRWSGQFLWNYADEKGAGVTQRRTYAQLKYDYFLNPKQFAWAVLSREDELRPNDSDPDPDADLDQRLTVGVGLGHQFRDDKEWKLQGEVGVAYIEEDYEEIGGLDDDNDYIAARLAYKADYTADDAKWSAGQWSELFPSLEDSEDVSARVDTHGRLNLTETMFAQAQWIFTWDNTPSTGSERADNLYMLSIGWSF